MLLAPPILPAQADSLPTSTLHALDGMAPPGRWAVRYTQLRNTYTRRFDNSGHRRNLDQDYDGLNLAALGLAGKLNLDTQVVTEFSELMFGYGLTADLTIGAIIPYVSTVNRVSWSVDGGIGKARLQQVLSGPLGYQPLATTRSSGLGDPTLGLLWRFHKSERDSAVLGFGVRFGLSKQDDPDNLVDIPPGDGSTDLRTRLEYFRDLGQQFDLRLLAEYQVQLPDEVRVRTGNPLTTRGSEVVGRNLGNYWEFDVELGKTLGDWRYSATWHRYQEGPDRYTSRLGSDTSFLSANTDTLADQYRLGVTWSGIRAWRAGWLPLPLIVKLEMQDAFRGRNFVDVRDIYLRVSTFF